MAHKIINQEDGQERRRKRFTLPLIEGKIGVGVFIGGKEVFLGVTIFPVIIEQVVKRKSLKPPKGRTKIFNMDF